MQQQATITTLQEYKSAVTRSIEIFHAQEGTPEAEELSRLLIIIKDFEDKYITIETPGE